MYKKVFGISAQLSDVLQSRSLDIGNAATLVLATIDRFQALRTDDQWNLLWEEATTFSQKHNISVTSVNWRQSIGRHGYHLESAIVF